MPRPPRDLAPGLFHVYAHSVWAADALFRDDDDRLKFIAELERTTRRCGWTCAAFCVMGTHYHLIVDVEAGVLAKGAHYLNFLYARHFNERHGMKGHVHGRRYGARRVETELGLRHLTKYLAHNPPKAGLSEKPEDWQYSTYGGTIGVREQYPFVDDRIILECFGGQTAYARAALQHYVDNE
jgi:putative transposase